MANPSSVELDKSISQHIAAFSQQAKKLYAVMEQKSRSIAASLSPGALNIESIKEPDMLEHLPAKIVLARRQNAPLNITETISRRTAWEISATLHEVVSTMFKQLTCLTNADAFEGASGQKKSLQDILLKLKDVEVKFKELIELTPEQTAVVNLRFTRWNENEAQKDNRRDLHAYMQACFLDSMLAWPSNSDIWNFMWHVRVLQSLYTRWFYVRFSEELKKEIMSLAQLRDKIVQVASKREQNEAN